jgi:FMN-dependent NADH-azoreductase
MKTLLYLQTSIFGSKGQSAVLADTFINHWRTRHPEGRIVVRDLTAHPLPHLDADRFLALLADPAQRTAEQSAVVAESDSLVAELRDADELLIGMPMYNFAVPSQFKSWFDLVARAGVTFKYTPSGAVGLLADRPTTVLATRGGRYQGGDADSQTPWLRQIFGFIGIRDLRFVYAEGIAMGEAAQTSALAAAREHISRLFR